MKNLDINELTDDLGLTRQNLNYHITKGRAGIIEKDGSTFTSKLIITPENALQLISWIASFGRGNKSKLQLAKIKYEKLLSEDTTE